MSVNFVIQVVVVLILELRIVAVFLSVFYFLNNFSPKGKINNKNKNFCVNNPNTVIISPKINMRL